jgi:protein required for attachment to host cells
MDADFARDIAKAIAAQIDATRPKRLILCASPAMLGELRGVGDAYRRPDVSVDEMPRDLVKLTPALLRDQLASYGLLPPAP